MHKGWVPGLIAAVLVLIVAGCTGKPNAAEQSLVTSPATHNSNQFSIVVGDSVKLKTSLEHETAIFDGTEYTIQPYGVTFAVRTDMGEPVVEGERIVFSSDLSGKATLSYEVVENTSLNEAVAKELQDHEGSFSGEFIETTSKGGLRGKHNQYKDESVFSGVIFYEFDQNVLRIEYRCPIAGVDAMIRIVNETVDSVR
ncbi:hypothetical protein [Paenibacillus fonticola]|uniref:hypothetical protein n=1 Tax=Paenibacillus fonticola TaxID=379896 RepID=UPI00036C3BE6|nr:hypothetical protein [Paenibacillus fonticola]